MKSQDKSTGALIVENLFLGDPCQNWLNIYSWFGEYRNCPRLVPKTEEEQRNKLQKITKKRFTGCNLVSSDQNGNE